MNRSVNDGVGNRVPDAHKEYHERLSIATSRGTEAPVMSTADPAGLPLEERYAEVRAPQFITLAQISIDPVLDTRADRDRRYQVEAMVRALEAQTHIRPVDLYEEVDGTLWLGDGRARAEAFTQFMGDVLAIVHPGGQKVAYLNALRANADHSIFGARRTDRDVRRAVTTALTDPDLAQCSNVLIAQICSCSDRDVSEIRNQLAAAPAVLALRMRATEARRSIGAAVAKAAIDPDVTDDTRIHIKPTFKALRELRALLDDLVDFAARAPTAPKQSAE